MAHPKLRILCFGDSLTSGYSGFGATYHPYNERLEEKLAEAFPQVQIEVTADGLPGDVSGMFMGRILQYCEPSFLPKPRDPFHVC
jgi:lysophospholipase L1-like esterase